MTFYSGVNLYIERTIREMIRLWRMHKFARDVRAEWRNVNENYNGGEFNTPTLKSVKKTYGRRKKWWRKKFTDKEVNEITRALAIDSFCTISEDKVDIKSKGMDFSDFSGFIEELIKRHKRTAVALGALVLFLFGKYL